MPDPAPAPIPRPTDPKPASPPPAAEALPSASLMQIVRAGGRDELALLHKTVWTWQSEQLPVRSADVPLRAECERWPEPIADRGPSVARLPETLGWREGVDVLIHGWARSPKPVTEMRVAVGVGNQIHEGIACGLRRVIAAGSGWDFSSPEPFTELALRAEFAYGGIDRAAERKAIEQVTAGMTADQRRRGHAPFTGMFANYTPFAYPRNQHGVGYCLSRDPADIAGRELPRLERRDDRLTPQRLLVPDPAAWLCQPLPLGFSGLDVAAFPRIAMAGLPPMGFNPGEPGKPGSVVSEVARGLVPMDFCRGNVVNAKPEDYAKLLHPAFGRNAALGLHYDQVAAHSRITLTGMDARGELGVIVPAVSGIAECPDAAGGRSPLRIALRPLEIAIDIDARQMVVILGGRAQVSQPLTPRRLGELDQAKQIRIEVQRR